MPQTRAPPRPALDARPSGWCERADRSDDAFCRRDLASQARVGPGCVVERAGERLEGGLGSMMVVLAGQQPHVQREAPVGGERLEQMRDHLAAQAAEGWPVEGQVD